MIKWGVIGTGHMANIFAESIQETDNAKLVAVSSRTKKSLEIFGDRFNIMKNFRFISNEEICASEDINAIYISTLNNTHFDLIKLCAVNKKNILCEKPMSLNIEEAKIAANFIKKFDVIFYEALAYTSHIQTKTFIDLINNNEIGEILSANATFGFKVKRVKAKSRIFNKLLGGGAILDIGCYPFSLINLIFKNDKNINFKSTKGSFAITGVDDSAEANLIIGNKISSNIKISFKENLDNKVVINGKSGSLTLSNPWLPELKSFIQIDHANSNYKKFITSEKTVFGNQIQNVSTKIKEKKMNEDFLVDIESSLEIMKNLTIWSNLIKVQ